MTAAPSQQLMRLAQHTLFEYLFVDGPERLVRVGLALMLCVDYALDQKLIGREDPRLPDYLDDILAPIYAYLGDPL